MKSVHIRDLPDDVHATLRRRAKEQGQSLQQYLLAELCRLAAVPTLEDVLKRLDTLDGPYLDTEEILQALDEGRTRQ